MDAYSENADRTKIICNASANVIDELPEVPKFLASEEKVKGITFRFFVLSFGYLFTKCKLPIFLGII